MGSYSVEGQNREGSVLKVDRVHTHGKKINGFIFQGKWV